MINNKLKILESIEEPCQNMLTSSIEQASLHLVVVMEHINALQLNENQFLCDSELNKLVHIVFVFLTKSILHVYT